MLKILGYRRVSGASDPALPERPAGSACEPVHAAEAREDTYAPRRLDPALDPLVRCSKTWALLTNPYLCANGESVQLAPRPGEPGLRASDLPAGAVPNRPLRNAVADLQAGHREWQRHICCPITLDLPTDPVRVIADDDNLYDRDSIKTWLKDHETLPLGKKKLPARVEARSDHTVRGLVHHLEPDSVADKVEDSEQFDVNFAKAVVRPDADIVEPPSILMMAIVGTMLGCMTGAFAAVAVASTGASAGCQIATWLCATGLGGGSASASAAVQSRLYASRTRALEIELAHVV